MIEFLSLTAAAAHQYQRLPNSPAQGAPAATMMQQLLPSATLNTASHGLSKESSLSY